MKNVELNIEDLKAVLFDMDGVLVDSMNYHLKSWLELLGIYNINVSEEFIYEHEGAMEPEIIMKLFKKYGYSIEIKDINNIYIKQNFIFKEKYLPSVTLYEGSLDLLKQLKEKGLLLGMVTSSRRNLINNIWKEEDLSFFSTIITADDTERFKPFPDPYLKALKEIKQEAKNCLVIENAPAGIKSAISAGIMCFAISSTLPRTSLLGAKQIFQDIKGLSNYFSIIFQQQ